MTAAMDGLRAMGNRARETGGCDRCVAMSHAAEHVDAVLQGIRELHRPTALAAAESVGGECHYCQETDFPFITRFRDRVNGSGPKVWMHTHEDPHPTCVTCAGAGWDMEYAAWPCPTRKLVDGDA